MTSTSHINRLRRRRPTTSWALFLAPLVVLSRITTVAAAVSIGTSRDRSSEATVAAAGLERSYNHRHTQNNDAANNNPHHDDVDPDNAVVTKKTTFRIFQTLPTEPSTMTPAELSQMQRTIRATQAMVFAPSLKHHTGSTAQQGITRSLQDDEFDLALDIYTPSERRDYLVQRGSACHPRRSGNGGGGNSLNALNDNDHGDEDTSSLQWYDVLSRYDSLMAASVKRGASEVRSSLMV